MSSGSGSTTCGQCRVERDGATCSSADSALPEQRQHMDCVRPGLALVYGDRFASEAARVCGSAASDGQRLYIVGCLLLNITASVNPDYSTYEKRRLSLTRQLARDEVSAAAESGLFLGPPADGAAGSGPLPPLRCFHCSAHVTTGQLPRGGGSSSSPESWWHRHRAVSPACYYVRLRDFVVAMATGAPPKSAVSGDVERFRRALRKLKRDLADSEALRLAGQFGYSAAALAFAATRHFMRNGGTVPSRAGDMIACLHACQELFEPRVIDSLEVRRVLGSLAMLIDPPQPLATVPAASLYPAGGGSIHGGQTPVQQQMTHEHTGSDGSSNGYHCAS